MDPFYQQVIIIVGKTRRHVCAFFQASCAIIFASEHRSTVFCILLWKSTFEMDKYTPCMPKWWSNMFFGGISCYFTANFKLLLLCLCYFFTSAICLCYFFTLFPTMPPSFLLYMLHANIKNGNFVKIKM